MTEQEIHDGVVVGGKADFASVAETLRQHGSAWCVIDNFAVNSYATPVYTANPDLVVAPGGIDAVLQDLRGIGFRAKSLPGSALVRRQFGRLVQGTCPLAIRLMTAERYQPFSARAIMHLVLGHEAPVAASEDVAQGKRWNLAAPARRASERIRDRFGLMRPAEEHFDEVVPLLPDELRATAEASRARRLDVGGNGWGDDDRGED